MNLVTGSVTLRGLQRLYRDALMQRVMIIGAPGSGKSAMRERTDLPVQHIDHFHYMSGWIVREREERLALLAQVQSIHLANTLAIEGEDADVVQRRSFLAGETPTG